MFGKMVGQLKMGEIPAPEELATLLKVALIKKQGVLQQPPACWSGDPKINPDTVHLLWAATLLGEEEEISSVAVLMINEMISRPGKSEPGSEISVVFERLEEMVALGPSPEFAALLTRKTARAREIISGQ